MDIDIQKNGSLVGETKKKKIRDGGKFISFLESHPSEIGIYESLMIPNTIHNFMELALIFEEIEITYKKRAKYKCQTQDSQSKFSPTRDYSTFLGFLCKAFSPTKRIEFQYIM